MQLLNQLRYNMTNFDILNRFFKINIFVINKVKLQSQLNKENYKIASIKSKNTFYMNMIYVKKKEFRKIVFEINDVTIFK